MPTSRARIDALRRWLPRGRRLPNDVWRRRHTAITGILWLHVGGVFLFALARGRTIGHSLVESLAVAAPAAVASIPALDRRLRTVITSLGLLTASAVLVHLSNGLIEMHFHFFVVVAVVALYQDWLPFLAAIAFVLLHHGVMGSINPFAVYNHRDAWALPWRWAAVHAGFILAISIACLVTWKLNESLVDQAAAIAIDNSRLYESERQARLAAENAQRRFSLLASVSVALTASLETREIIQGVADLVAGSISDYCVIDMVTQEGSTERIACAATPAYAEVVTSLRDMAPDLTNRSNPIALAMLEGQTQFLPSIPDLVVADALRNDKTVALLRVHQPTSLISVPLVGRDRIIGALSVSTFQGAGRAFDTDDVSLMEEAARRVTIAIEHAELYARQRSVAATLQHSLLPDKLPAVPGLETAVRYISGGPGTDVGGDWYDVMQLPDGSIALTMGDVVGRGERAASLMGQLRNAARAYALDGRGPAQIAERLNRMLIGIGPESMATMIYAVVDADSGTLRFVNAGHPPPLLFGPDANAAFLEAPGCVPLGALPWATYSESVASLQPGATLLLYTDGLSEDRTSTVEVEFARLIAAAHSAPHDLDAACDHFLDTMLKGREKDDDVALLAVRLTELGASVDLTLARDPSVLAPLRSTLRRWLTGQDATEQEVYEIVVAAGEACANAVQHAFGPTHADFRVTGGITDGVVSITVQDHGRWRTPRDNGGGRGIGVMKEFMDAVDVTTDTRGTVVEMRRALTRHRADSEAR